MSMVIPTVLRRGCLCGASIVTRHDTISSDRRSRRATRSRMRASMPSEAAGDVRSLYLQRRLHGQAPLDPRAGRRRRSPRRYVGPTMISTMCPAFGCNGGAGRGSRPMRSGCQRPFWSGSPALAVRPAAPPCRCVRSPPRTRSAARQQARPFDDQVDDRRTDLAGAQSPVEAQRLARHSETPWSGPGRRVCRPARC